MRARAGSSCPMRRMVALYDGVRPRGLPPAAGKDVAAGRATIVRVLGFPRSATGITRRALRSRDRDASLGFRNRVHRSYDRPTDRRHREGRGISQEPGADRWMAMLRLVP